MKVVQNLDFHDDDFIIQNGKVRSVKRLKTYNLTFAAPKTTVTTNNPVDYDSQGRHQLSVMDGMGKIHLDFKMLKDSGGALALFQLPSNAPPPVELIESQVHDGGTLWVGPGSRTVYGNSLKANTRYIIDLVGFFV